MTTRRALGAGQDLKEFDVDNAYGLTALTRILSDCIGATLHMEAVQVGLSDPKRAFSGQLCVAARLFRHLSAHELHASVSADQQSL